MLTLTELEYASTTIIVLQCDHCSNLFTRNKKTFRRAPYTEVVKKRHFCDRKCVAQFNQKLAATQVEMVCSCCNSTFLRKSKNRKNLYKVYCSKRCANIHNHRRQPEGKCKDCDKPTRTCHVRCQECKAAQAAARLTHPKVLNSAQVKNFYQRSKVKAVAYLGGCCLLCGYDKCTGALQFHHVDPTTKGFTISGRTMAWVRLKPELDKCVLLCSRCHTEVELGVTKLPLEWWAIRDSNPVHTG